MVGDFNCPDIDWSVFSATSHFSTLFCELIFDYQLTQCVDFPTHILGNTLDLILTNSPHKVGDVSVTKTFPSDHYAINFNIYCRNSNFTGFTSPTTFLNYIKADYQGMCDYLLDWDFSECFKSNNVEEIWSLIKSAIHAAISQFVPVSRTSRRQGHLPKWFDSSLRYDLKRLRTLRRKCSTRPISHLA